MAQSVPARRTATVRVPRSRANDVVPHTPRARRQHIALNSPGTKASQEATAAPQEDTAPVEPSARTKRLMEAVRRPLLAFAEDFSAVTASRADLAPKFMRAFAGYATDTGGTFIAFVRDLDPAVPPDRDGYRAHQTYQAADYLRRLEARATQDTAEDRLAPASPVDVIASLIASMALVVDDPESIWTAFQTSLHWTPARITSLQKRVAETKPLLVKHGRERLLRAS